jgi:hypothetical protein
MLHIQNHSSSTTDLNHLRTTSPIVVSLRYRTAPDDRDTDDEGVADDDSDADDEDGDEDDEGDEAEEAEDDESPRK